MGAKPEKKYVEVSPVEPPAPLPRTFRVHEGAAAVVCWFPLTPVGLTMVSAALLAAWIEGIGHLDMILLMVSFCIVVVYVLMLAAVLIGTFVVRRALSHPIGRTCNVLEAEVQTASGFAIRLPKWLPFLEVSWTWENAEGACHAETTQRLEGRDTREIVVPWRRGEYTGILRRVRVSDILGLCRVTWREKEAIALRVLPHRGNVDRLVPLMGIVSGEDISNPYGDPWGDRVDMRQYTPGDSPRMILWKVYARSRKLMVRIPERAVSARPRGCCYLVADVWPRSSRRQESTDEAGAGVARVILERHLLGEGWSFAADGGGDPASTLSNALDVLARSGTPAVASTGFADFIARAVSDGFGYCVLFLPPRPGPWMDVVTDVIQRTPLRVHVFIGVDNLASIVKSERPSFLHRLVLRAGQRHRPTLRELTEVVSTAGTCATQVCVVDRAAGQLFPDPLAVLIPSRAS